MKIEKKLTELLTKTTKQFPNAWAMAEALRVDGKDIAWDSFCFVPLAGWFHIVNKTSNIEENTASESVAANTLSILGAWRYSQSIYDINRELAKELIGTNFTGNIPTEVLYKIPEWCVYIKTYDYSFSGLLIEGFFAQIQNTIGVGKLQAKEIIFLLKEKDSDLTIPLSLPLGEGNNLTLIESIRLGYGRANGIDLDDNLWKERVKNLQEQVAPLLNLLLYVCSEGVEYQTVERPTMPKHKNTRRYGKRLYPAKAPRVWKLGQTTGNALSEARERSIGTERKGVRPHIRRAHWHTFYAGKRDQEREVRIKWIPPTPVAMPPEE